MRLSRGDTLLVATHNSGKLREIADLLSPFAIATKSAAELHLPEPEESGVTFTENALLKARAAAQASGLVSLADDSGLCVTALDGAPGIYSARWTGPTKEFAFGMSRIENELREKETTDFSAKFVCVLALVLPDDGTETFEGEVHGRLQFPPRGNKGFGYDPIFVPEGLTQTFGELEPGQKHAMSHRSRAFEKFLAATGLSNPSEP
jgi:XTP/dITP diphosphohydrolase